MGQINELKDFTRGQLDAALMKIGHDAGMGTAEGIKAFLAGKLTASVAVPAIVDLHEIRLSVTSDGTTGKAWRKRLEKKGFRISDYAKQLLRSKEFKATAGVTFEVVIIKGSFWESDNDRTTANIRVEATKRMLVAPNVEVACLLREKLTDQEIEAMGLWWIAVMHDPIKDSDGDPNLLDLSRYDNGRWLNAHHVKPGDQWFGGSGFAFVLPQGA